MILIETITYVSLFVSIIFLFYILLYKSYSLSTSKITTPDQALAELIRGNKKYNSFLNFITRANRKSVATVQRPFAIVLSCSDSRVPTEIIFNQLNLGSLFIIRNAGNVVDGVVLGSIEFGITELKTVLVIVLGHERCGSVIATIDAILEHRPEPSGHIKDIMNAMYPAAHNILQKLNIDHQVDDQLKETITKQVVKENVRLIVKDLPKHSDIITQALDEKKIKVIGAYYDLDDGDVKIIT